MRVASARRVLRLGAAIIAFGLLCITAGPALAQESTTLRGVVTSQNDRAPQVAATVGIPKLDLYVLTNENGEYLLPVPVGTHVVRVEATGLLAVEQTVVVGATPAVQDFQLAEDRL